MSDGEMSELEWRQMRRKLPCLQFEPVPETPPLLPRSVYEDDERPAVPETRHSSNTPNVGDLTRDILSPNDTETPSLVAASAPPAPSIGPDPLPASTETPPQALPEGKQQQHGATSAAATVTPSRSPRRRLARRRGSGSSTAQATAGPLTPTTTVAAPVPPDWSALEAQVTTAQESLRRVILAAVSEASQRWQRESDLERKRLEAAHVNERAMLEARIRELETSAAGREQDQRRDQVALERALVGLHRRAMQTRAWWTAAESVRACFAAWKLRGLAKRQKRTQQHVVKNYSARTSQQLLLQQWKLMTHESQWEKRLGELEARHSATMDATVRDYEDRIRDLATDAERARGEAALAQQGRQQLEEDLRQVFLRGVSAMNLEALTLFRANHRLRSRAGAADDAAGAIDLAAAIPSGADSGIAPTAAATARCDDSRAPNASPIPLDGPRATVEGGETTEELPSDDRMLPVRSPIGGDDLRVKLDALLPLPPPAIPDAGDAEAAIRPVSAPMPVATMPSASMVSALCHGSAVPVPTPRSTPQPPPTAAIHGLRSAELVEAHQRVLHATTTGTPSPQRRSSHLAASSSSSVPSPALQRERTQGSTRYQVEVEYMRSAVSTAVLDARYGPTPQSTPRRGSHLQQGPTLTAASTATRRASSTSGWRRG